jgi:ADP-ribose pyrophosphatase
MADLAHWQTLHRETIFAGGPIKEVAIETVALPDGRRIPDYYVIRLADFVLIYAETDDGTVLMLRQYKHGLRRVCLTFPGGAIEDRESPVMAARRELLEETGYEATEWHSLGAFGTNANQGCNAAHLFRATGCRLVAEPNSRDLEQISLELLPPARLLHPTALHEIGLASHVALLLLATHSSRLLPGADTPQERVP